MRDRITDIQELSSFRNKKIEALIRNNRTIVRIPSKEDIFDVKSTHDCTIKILVAYEFIIDSVIHLRALILTERGILIKNHFKGSKLATLEENSNFLILLGELSDIVDSYPEHKNRLRYNK